MSDIRENVTSQREIVDVLDDMLQGTQLDMGKISDTEIEGLISKVKTSEVLIEGQLVKLEHKSATGTLGSIYGIVITVNRVSGFVFNYDIKILAGGVGFESNNYNIVVMHNEVSNVINTTVDNTIIDSIKDTKLGESDIRSLLLKLNIRSIFIYDAVEEKFNSFF